jgi:hypothetical protein
MLADRGNFILVETAKIDAILQSNHAPMLLLSSEDIIIEGEAALIGIKNWFDRRNQSGRE